MRKFNKQQIVAGMKGALKLRSEINQLIDQIADQGYRNVCWLGIGGTYASSMQAVVHMKEKSGIETFYQNAAEYLTTGNRRITDQTLVITSSVTGNTKEVVDAVKQIKAAGATILGFIDRAEADLASLVTHCISYPENEQLKFFMVADRLMYLKGEFPEYEEF